jgi:hypothetical protein
MTDSIHIESTGSGVIHYSDMFPIQLTPCGRTRVPAAHEWNHVTCSECLDMRELEQTRAGLVSLRASLGKDSTDLHTLCDGWIREMDEVIALWKRPKQ